MTEAAIDRPDLAESLADRGVSEERAPGMAEAVIDGDVDRVVALLEADLADHDEEVDQFAQRVKRMEGQLSPASQADLLEIIENLRSLRDDAQSEIDKVRELDGDELIEWASPEEAQ